LALVIGVQLVVLAAGLSVILPTALDSIAQTSFQAPSTLKLVIEVLVFSMKLLLKTIGLVVLLLLPTWAGLVYVMAKRSREGYFVDITPDGVTIGNPTDRFFIERKLIGKIQASRFFPVIPTLSLYCGRRRIILRKLVSNQTKPEKKALWSWLGAKAPTRIEVSKSMQSLKQSLEALVKENR
jgi:hypothetical protein